MCPARSAAGFWQSSGVRVIKRGSGSELLSPAPNASLPQAQGQRVGRGLVETGRGFGPEVRDPERASGRGGGFLASDSPAARPWAAPRPPRQAGPHYSRVPVGLMGEAAPELSLPPAASFSFLPLYWPMKEPSSLNCTSTLPP